MKTKAEIRDFFFLNDAHLDGIRAAKTTVKLVTGEQQLLCQPGWDGLACLEERLSVGQERLDSLQQLALNGYESARCIYCHWRNIMLAEAFLLVEVAEIQQHRIPKWDVKNSVWRWICVCFIPSQLKGSFHPLETDYLFPAPVSELLRPQSLYFPGRHLQKETLPLEMPLYPLHLLHQHHPHLHPGFKKERVASKEAKI